MVAGPRARSALRRASIFWDASGYLHALSRRLCSASPRWDPSDARRHVRWLAAAAGLAHPAASAGQPLPRTQRRALLRSVLQLRSGMPLAYVLQSAPFVDLELAIRPPTLIPRPETEEWAVRLASLLPRGLNVLDLCTGSGAIGLYLAHATQARATLVDVSPTAVALAQENAQRLSASLAHAPAVVQADLFAPPAAFTGTSTIDLVVCNPPYITPSEYARLDEAVRAWEDRGALLGVHPDRSLATAGEGHDDDLRGIAFYRRLAQLVPVFFRGGAQTAGGTRVPQLVLEIGHTQAADVVQALRSAPAPAAGLELQTHVWQDMAGKDRVVAASWVRPM